MARPKAPELVTVYVTDVDGNTYPTQVADADFVEVIHTKQEDKDSRGRVTAVHTRVEYLDADDNVVRTLVDGEEVETATAEETEPEPEA